MATLRQHIDLNAAPDDVWAALKDFGALHERLVRSFVTNATLTGTTRTITFFDGTVLDEHLVGIDEDHRRLAYAITDGFTHYNGSAQVYPNGDGATLVWIVDVLPDDVAPRIAAMMRQGATAMRDTLDRTAV